MKKFLFFLLSFLFVGGAFATGDSIPTSKSYVDAEIAQKQEIIPANSGTTQVITNTGTDGEIGTKDIYNSSNSYAGQSGALIDAATMNAAVQNAINSEFECVEDDGAGNCLLLNFDTYKNFFDINAIRNNDCLVNNGDGTITAFGSSSNSVCSTGRKLLKIAPDLIVGKDYKLTFDTTAGSKYIQIMTTNGWIKWYSGTIMTITEELLNGEFTFQSRVNGSCTISNINLVLANQVYIPSGQ